MLLPADDTGIKGDGVTSNHNPRFTGVTDKGDTVSLYAVVNGQLEGPEATTTSSTVNGSFTFRLPFNLTDGTTELVAQTSDIANNKTNLSLTTPLRRSRSSPPPATISVSGQGPTDRLRPLQRDLLRPGTSGPSRRSTRHAGPRHPRAVRPTTGMARPTWSPIGSTRRNTTATCRITRGSTSSSVPAGLSLPVSGLLRQQRDVRSTAPTRRPPGPGISPCRSPAAWSSPSACRGSTSRCQAAYNGYNSDRTRLVPQHDGLRRRRRLLQRHRPQQRPLRRSASAARRSQKLGFTYQPGDIAAPGDYDGVGHGPSSPSTGRAPASSSSSTRPATPTPATWTLRTVTLNLPGGPNVNDVPVSEDYYGGGKASTPRSIARRTRRSTSFNSATGLQSEHPVRPRRPTSAIAAAGPILYRLTALFGVYASGRRLLSDHHHRRRARAAGGVTTLSISPAAAMAAAPCTPSRSPSATTSASRTPSSASPGSPLSTMIAVAAPLAVTTTPTPTPPTPDGLLEHHAAARPLVTVGASTPRIFVRRSSPSSKPSAADRRQGQEGNQAPSSSIPRSHETEPKAAAHQGQDVQVGGHGQVAFDDGPRSSCTRQPTRRPRPSRMHEGRLAGRHVPATPRHGQEGRQERADVDGTAKGGRTSTKSGLRRPDL